MPFAQGVNIAFSLLRGENECLISTYHTIPPSTRLMYCTRGTKKANFRPRSQITIGTQPYTNIQQSAAEAQAQLPLTTHPILFYT